MGNSGKAGRGVRGILFGGSVHSPAAGNSSGTPVTVAEKSAVAIRFVAEMPPDDR